MTHGKTYNKSPRRINHKATKSKTNTGTTALESQISRFCSSVMGQYQFKRKSCEEQFHFNASLEDKFTDIDCSLTNLNAESVERAQTSVQEGKSLIQQRQKMGWKVVSEYQADPLASDSDDERNKYKAEVRAERNARKGQLKRLRTRKLSFRGKHVSSGQAIQPQSQVIGNPRPATANATATTSGGRPGNVWYCGSGGTGGLSARCLKRHRSIIR